MFTYLPTCLPISQCLERHVMSSARVWSTWRYVLFHCYAMSCYVMLCYVAHRSCRTVTLSVRYVMLLCYVMWRTDHVGPSQTGMLPCFILYSIRKIAKCQYICARDVWWCQVHSSHISANHETLLNYNKNNNNSKHWGKSH